MIGVPELATHSSHHDTWLWLRATNPWSAIIERSEPLKLHHFHARLDEYLQRAQVRPSWLSYQRNLSSTWDPRPG